LELALPLQLRVLWRLLLLLLLLLQVWPGAWQLTRWLLQAAALAAGLVARPSAGAATAGVE
jgi:hypothetical protein